MKGYEDDLLTVVPPGLLGESADEELASTTGGLFNAVFPGGHLWSGIMVAVLLFQPDALLTARDGLEPIARGLPPLRALAVEASSRNASSPEPSAAPIVEPPTPSPARAPSVDQKSPPKPSPTSSPLDVALEELGRIPVNGQ